MNQISCDCCGGWFWARSEDESLCVKCRGSRKETQMSPRLRYESRGGEEKGKKLFDLIVANKQKGITVHQILKYMNQRVETKTHGVSNILSILDRTGYLVYTEGNKIFPYKDTHTGVVYE